MSTAPVIVEAAINGRTTKERNPNVPTSPREITADALACIDAGAAVVHSHIDLFGISAAAAAERYLDGWRPIVDVRPDALLCPAVHFGSTISYEHLGPLAASGMLRLAAVDPGSVNVGDVDIDGVPLGDVVHTNTFDVIAGALEDCREYRLGPRLAIHEPGHVRTVTAWWRAGRLPAGAFIKLYFSAERGPRGGAPFGLPPTITALDAYLELLEGCDLPWSVTVVDGDVTNSEIGTVALERGGHLHVGIEFYGGGGAPTNAELVSAAVALVREVGRPVAAPDDAAALLRLPSLREPLLG
jgi:uncharacterized protein (DUF849 family)